MATYKDDLSRRIKAVNARITVVQRIYGKDSSIFKRIVSTIQRARHDGGTRFKRSMFDGSLRELSKAENALRVVESSQYLTKEGRKRIGEKARETFRQNRLDMGYDEATFEKIADVFANSSLLQRVKEMYNDSDLFVDAIMRAIEDDDSFSVSDFTDKLDDYIRRGIERSENLDDFVEKFLDEFEEE